MSKTSERIDRRRVVVVHILMGGSKTGGRPSHNDLIAPKTKPWSASFSVPVYSALSSTAGIGIQKNSEIDYSGGARWNIAGNDKRQKKGPQKEWGQDMSGDYANKIGKTFYVSHLFLTMTAAFAFSFGYYMDCLSSLEPWRDTPGSRPRNLACAGDSTLIA